MSSLTLYSTPAPQKLNNPYIKETDNSKELLIHGFLPIATIPFTALTTISQIQTILEKAEICPKLQQRLISNGKQFNEDDTLADVFQAYLPSICLIMRLKSAK